MKRYIHEPGNATRYDLYYGPANSSGLKYILVWALRGGSGGQAFVFDRDGVVSADYLMEKMALSSIADAAALLAFLSEQGVSVVMPQGFSNAGVWCRHEA